MRRVTSEPQPRILARPDHPISRQSISENTLKVLYRLHNQGFRAYLVGGAVRDLMLDRVPKDFDVGTDARPNDIRRLFRNSRIIGRRFRLVHVFFPGGEIVEVSTFRRDPQPEDQDGDSELLITDDNTYGTPREDAFRRDFTVNALFYDISDFSVIDYVGGIEDLDDGVVRTIGEPDVRFQEDPVRMLRACEFAARLGFGIDRETQQAIYDQRRELEKASPARLIEEVLGLLRCGAAGRAIQWLIDLGVLEVMLPEAFDMVTVEERGMGRFDRLPAALDAAAEEGVALSDATVLGALLLPRVLLRRFDVEAVDQRPMRREALDAMIAEEVGPFIARLAVSRDRAGRMLAALTGFQRLIEPELAAKARVGLAHRPWFDDALALFDLLVRATGEGGEALADWRRVASHRSESRVQAAADEERRRDGRSRRRRRSRTRRRR
jgi:poly(A) polymerase